MELAYGITGNRFYADKPELKQRRLTEIQDLCSKFTVLPFGRKSAMKTAQIMACSSWKENL